MNSRFLSNKRYRDAEQNHVILHFTFQFEKKKKSIEIEINFEKTSKHVHSFEF